MKEIIRERLKERKKDIMKAAIWLAVCIVVFFSILILAGDDSNSSFVVSTGVVSFIGIIYYIVALLAILLSKKG